MRVRRREILKTGGRLGALALALATGMFKPRQALAQQWNKAAFESRGLDATLRALGAAGAAESRDVRFIDPTPEIAENGEVVPIAVTSAVPGTRSIALLVEKNPSALAASFDIPEGTEAFVSTRLKMAGSSKVYALVRAGGRHFYAVRDIKVTLGGCGA